MRRYLGALSPGVSWQPGHAEFALPTRKAKLDNIMLNQLLKSLVCASK